MRGFGGDQLVACGSSCRIGAQLVFLLILSLLYVVYNMTIQQSVYLSVYISVYCVIKTCLCFLLLKHDVGLKKQANAKKVREMR